MVNIHELFPYSEYRKSQKEAIDTIVSSFFTNNKKYFFLKMPTGGGKSGIAYTLSRFFVENYCKTNNNLSKPYSVICTYTKQLQKQYYDDPNFKNNGFVEHIWSSTDYDCNEFPIEYDIHYGDPYCKRKKCKYFNNKLCNYVKQKIKFMRSDIGIVNYPYILSLIKNDDVDILNNKLLICDEGHLLDEILCDVYSISFNISSFKQVFNTVAELTDSTTLSIGEIKNTKKMLQNIINNITQDNDFITDTSILCEYVIEKFSKFIEIIMDFTSPNNTSKQNKKDIDKVNKSFTIIKRYLSNATIFLDSLTNINTIESNIMQWIVHKHDKIKSMVSFKPLLPDLYFRKFTSRCSKVLIMSAHIECKEELISKYKMNESEFDYLDINSIIPIKRRPIFLCNLGYFTNKNITDDMLKNFIISSDKIIKMMNDSFSKLYDNKQVPGIIHTTSYKNADIILSTSKYKDRMILPLKEDLLDFRNFISKNGNKILVSPILLQGIDLPDDKSRFQIFFKIPYPSLDDNWLKERMKYNSNYYNMKTITNFEQGCGRSIRSINDWAFTFVLDSMINVLLKKNKSYFSNSIIDSMIEFNIE